MANVGANVPAGVGGSGSVARPPIVLAENQPTNEQLIAMGAWPRPPDDQLDDVIWMGTTFPGFEHLPDFDIRNGDPEDAKPMLVRPTIPRAYHWVPVSGISPQDAVTCVDAYIQSAYFQLLAYPVANMTDAQARKVAIILGTSRAVMTKHYRLVNGDFIGGELATSHIHATMTTQGKYAFKPVAARNAQHRAVLDAPLVYSETESAAIAVLLMSAIGALPVQGYSLIMTGHHYLSEGNNPSRKAYAVMEKQFWNAAAVKDYFASDLQLVQDAAWHKAGHPVSIMLKEEFACDDRVPTMLRATGAGSAASRLPAMEAQLRAASSYLALLDTVDPLFKMFGGGADASQLVKIMDVVKKWPRNETATAYSVPDWVPMNINTKKEALSWLGEVLARNAPKAAYCYGFYCALSDSTQAMTGTGGSDSLKTSYSLAKLKMGSHAAYTEGTLAYGDYAAARNRRKAEGKYDAARVEFSIE